MKKLIAICAAIAVILTVNGVSSAVNKISYGTVGTGATATVTPVGVELSTAIGTGTAGSAYVRLNIDGGIALNAITSLSYTSKITTAGAGGFALEVVLNTDADGDATLEGTGIDWMAQNHNPATLGYVASSNRGDNFLSGDNNPPGAGTPDLTFVTRDALGNYYYWNANDARNGFGNFWSPFSTIVPGMLPVNDIDGTDLVYSIDFVVGTSGNFDGMKAIVSSVELNGTSYAATCLFVIAGDLNDDCRVDFMDLKVLCEQWLQPPGLPSADITPSPSGDGRVNFQDFAVMAANWLIDCDTNPSDPACVPK